MCLCYKTLSTSACSSKDPAYLFSTGRPRLPYSISATRYLMAQRSQPTDTILAPSAHHESVSCRYGTSKRKGAKIGIFNSSAATYKAFQLSRKWILALRSLGSSLARHLSGLALPRHLEIQIRSWSPDANPGIRIIKDRDIELNSLKGEGSYSVQRTATSATYASLVAGRVSSYDLAIVGHTARRVERGHLTCSTTQLSRRK